MSNYIISNGELYNQDELMHWKYIKREKQADGTYKYYYNDPKKAKATVEKAAEQMSNARQAMGTRKAYARLASTYGVTYPTSKKTIDEKRLAEKEYKKAKADYNAKKNDTVVNDVKKAVKNVGEKIKDKKSNTTKLPNLNKKRPEYTEYSYENGKQVKTITSDSNSLLSDVKTADFGDSELVLKKRGTLERISDNAKAYMSYKNGVSGRKMTEIDLISDETQKKIENKLGMTGYENATKLHSEMDTAAKEYASVMIAYASNSASSDDVAQARKKAIDAAIAYDNSAKQYNSTLLGKLDPAQRYLAPELSIEGRASGYMTDQERARYESRKMWGR